MNIAKIYRLLVASLPLMVASCTLEPYVLPSEELYTRNFIKKFGLIDEKQDWNLAKESKAQVNLGSQQAKSVKIYGKMGDRYYLIADLENVSGKVEVPVDVPEDCVEMRVIVDGQQYDGRLDMTLDISGLSRGVPGVTYGHSGDSDYTNPNPPVKTWDDSENGYKVEIKHTCKASSEINKFTIDENHPEYQYFNTRQVSPIVSKTPWTKYQSLNTKKWSIDNTSGSVGLLPESGVYNRKMSDLQTWLAEKKAEGQSMVEDFRISPGADGFFTIFPFYYGTNLQHELGVYLLDDDFNPILNNDRGSAVGNDYTLDDFVYYPIFKTRDHGDLQIQPHYDAKIQEIRLDYPGIQNGNWITIKKGTEVNIEQYVKIKVKDGNTTTEMSYADYLDTYGAKTHSRVTYHVWTQEGKQGDAKAPVEYAKCDRDGNFTALQITKGYQEYRSNNNLGMTNMCVAIATGIKEENTGKGWIYGVKHDINVTIVPEKDPYTVSFDTSSLPAKVSVDSDDGHPRLNIPSTYNGTLPIVVKSGNDVVSDWTTDDFTIEQYPGSSPFEIGKAGDKSHFTIRAKDNAAESNWAHLIYKEGTSDEVNFAFIVKVYPDVITHTWTASYTGLPGGMTYSDFVDSSHSGTTTLYSDTHVLGWNNDLTLSALSDVRAGDVIKITFSSTSGNQIKVAVLYPWYVIKDQWVGDNTTAEVTLSSDDADAIKAGDWTIQGAGTVTKVELIKSGFDASAAQTAIANYYRSNLIGGTCEDGDGETLSSTDADTNITVGITNTSESDFAYTVTLSKTVPVSSAPKRHSAKAKRTTSRNSAASNTFCIPMSRAGTYDMSALLTEDYDGAKWVDVSSYFTRYLRAGEEVSSYPVDMDMLGRTRGYDVRIMVKGKDGDPDKPYTGYLGVYLKILGSNDLTVNEDTGWEESKTGDSYTEFTGNKSYVVFSQRRFNRQEDNDALYPQISAISSIHPSSGDTFLSFEDMRVTHAGPGEKGGTEYKFWEKSSDRDVNDVVFKIYGVDDISNDEGSLKPEEVDDEGFPWILAVEDLGSVDDFDFNDLVVKVTSITRELVTPADEQAGTPETIEYLSKKVVFVPLAAGGTLPLYLRWNDYTLSPGTYYLGDAAPSGVTGASPLSGLQGAAPGVGTEIHQWFGTGYPSTQMLNTKAPGLPGRQCVLYVPIDRYTGSISPYNFTISGFGASKQSVDGNKDNVGIHVYVQDGRSDQMGDITEGWTVKRPEDGAVSQMFIIYDTKNKWRWPYERNPINIAYPRFDNWVGNTGDYDWFENYDGKGGVIDRTDK